MTYNNMSIFLVLYYLFGFCLIIYFFYRTITTYNINLSYKDKLKKLKKQIKEKDGVFVKDNPSHLFGLKKFKKANKINLSNFCKVLNVDISNNEIELEGLCTIKQVLDILIPRGYMLPIIPDMSHLSMGGIVSGVGGGSASFKNGCFHDSMTECDVLTGDGKVLTCSEKENTDLFRAIPNLLGTMGYITRLKMKIVKTKPYVNTINHKYDNYSDFINSINKFKIDKSVDFLDGTIIDSKTFICIVGKLTDEEPDEFDNFVNEKIYWKSIITEKNHSFKLIDYIYRWDTDLYYTSINEKIPQFINNPSIRKLVPKSLIPYVKMVLPHLGLEINIEDIVQDVLIPINRSTEFFEWYDKNISLYPVYICPSVSKDNKFSFWTDTEVLDFGVGYGIIPENAKEKTLQIEKKMLELGGRKLLYSIHQMSEDDFWTIYDKDLYNTLRDKYNSKFPSLFDKLKK